MGKLRWVDKTNGMNRDLGAVPDDYFDAEEVEKRAHQRQKVTGLMSAIRAKFETKYEHLTDCYQGVIGDGSLETWLDTRGQQGWQLVCKAAEESACLPHEPKVYSIWFVFMRAKE